MKYDIIKFEDINFNNLKNITFKKTRQVFKSNNEKLVYKFFSKDWEFADMCEIGINENIYSSKIIPNFKYLIKDIEGKNRGYVCEEFTLSQKFYKYDNSNNLIYYFLHKTKSYFFIYKNKEHFLTLLKNLFYTFLNSKYIFISINKESIWCDKNGYYIFDLESIRSKKWLFDNNYNDEDFLRKKYNLEFFNNKIQELFKIHNMEYPIRIEKENDIKKFYDYLIKL